jgi:hypothetical protein
MTLTFQLNQKAKAILIRELGPVNYARFIQQYEEEQGTTPLTVTNGSARKAHGPCMSRRPNLLPTANSHARAK